MKYFLASVGNAELLEKKDGKLTLFASARTLTDSSLSFTSSMEEVRAGTGAKLYGRFNNSTGMTVALTDAMFDLKYIAGQVGAAIEKKGSVRMIDEGAVFTDAKTITITKTPAILGEGCGLEKYVVWYKQKDCQTGEMFAVEATYGEGKFTCLGNFPGYVADAEYCIYYMQETPAARSMKIGAEFNPKELVLLLTTNLYAGDASHPETGKPVGSITVKIPRFQLDGQFDLSMAMTSAASMSLNGTVLVSGNGDCEESGIYAEIVEVINGRDPQKDIIGIRVANAEDYVTEEPESEDDLVVYAIYADGDMKLLDSDEFTYSNGNVTAELGGKTFTAIIQGGKE